MINATFNILKVIMKNWIMKYNLEIFSTIVLLFVGVMILFFPEISYVRKITLAYAILAILHEFEEKRTPGGFFELMAKKFELPENTNLDLASFFVICYWLVLIMLPFVFDSVEIFLVMPIALGIFETFIHTAGIWIHHMKKPYTPGLASAWPMGALSVYSIYFLNTYTDISGTDYLIGVILMVIGFLFLERGTLYAANMTFKDLRNKIINTLNSK